MSSLRPLHWETLDALLKKQGYTHTRTKGSHLVYCHSDKLFHVVVPKKRAIPVGTLMSIIKQMGMPRSEFIRLVFQLNH